MLGLKVLLAGVSALACHDPGRIMTVSLFTASHAPVVAGANQEPSYDAVEVFESMFCSVFTNCTLVPDFDGKNARPVRGSESIGTPEPMVSTNRPLKLALAEVEQPSSGDTPTEILTLGVVDEPMRPVAEPRNQDDSSQMREVHEPIDDQEPDAASKASPQAEDEMTAVTSEDSSRQDKKPTSSELSRIRISQFGGRGGSGMTDFGSALLAGGEPIKMQPVSQDQNRTPNKAPEQMVDVSEVGDLGILEASPNQVPTKLLRLQVDESLVLKSRVKLDRVEVPDPGIVDVSVSSPQEVTIIGKTVGSTQIMITGGGQIQNCQVMVGPNYKPLQNLIRAVSPQSSVRVDGLKGTIVLSGRAPDAETAKKIEEMAKVFQGGEVLNHIYVSGVQQTMLRVTVAEVNKDALRSLGINWAVGGSKLSRDFFLANNIGQLNPTNFGSNGLTDLTTGQLLYSVNPVGTGPLTNITFGFPRAELQFFMNALRENSLARTLAEPTLVAISGQTASFLAGGEVPIPVTQGGAVAGAITIEYKEFGVRLAFTPTVLGNQLMRLHVMSEVSDAVETSRVVGTLPLFTFTTRRVETTIECGNGQSFAIAGLLNDKVRAISSRIPGVGDIPVIGALFSSVEYRNDKTELVVLVTPELVEAMDPQQVLPPPGAKMRDPSDFELFGLGQLEGKAPTESSGEPIDESTASKDQHTTNRQHSLAELPLNGPWGQEELTQD